MATAIQDVLNVVDVHPRVLGDTQNLYEVCQSQPKIAEDFPTPFEELQIFFEYSKDGHCRLSIFSRVS